MLCVEFVDVVIMIARPGPRGQELGVLEPVRLRDDTEPRPLRQQLRLRARPAPRRRRSLVGTGRWALDLRGQRRRVRVGPAGPAPEVPPGARGRACPGGRGVRSAPGAATRGRDGSGDARCIV